MLTPSQIRVLERTEDRLISEETLLAREIRQIADDYENGILTEAGVGQALAGAAGKVGKWAAGIKDAYQKARGGGEQQQQGGDVTNQVMGMLWQGNEQGSTELIHQMAGNIEALGETNKRLLPFTGAYRIVQHLMQQAFKQQGAGGAGAAAGGTGKGGLGAAGKGGLGAAGKGAASATAGGGTGKGGLGATTTSFKQTK